MWSDRIQGVLFWLGRGVLPVLLAFVVGPILLLVGVSSFIDWRVNQQIASARSGALLGMGRAEVAERFNAPHIATPDPASPHLAWISFGLRLDGSNPLLLVTFDASEHVIASQVSAGTAD